MHAVPSIHVAADAGTEPVRTSDPAHARELLRRHGAAILTGAGRGPDAAVAAAVAVFGESALAVPPAAEVRSGGVFDALAARRPPDQSLQAHTDGFSYGDLYPDHFLLLCDRDSPVGGESFLVDTYRVLDTLAASEPGASIVERFAAVALEQTEEGKRRSVSPVVGRAPGGRRMVRRFPEQRPTAESADRLADGCLVAAWDGLCRLAAATAPRFRLAPGEVVLVDNYRMLHGREAYEDLDRLMWRVWVWTDEGAGVPPGVLASDSRNADALEV